MDRDLPVLHTVTIDLQIRKKDVAGKKRVFKIEVSMQKKKVEVLIMFS